MKMLEVAEDGELKESPFKAEDVDSNKVYIFVNDDEKQIILWSGKEAKTRNKFIGARLASSIRLEHGLSYKLLQVDESVDQDFIRNVGKPGRAPSSPSQPATAAIRQPTPSTPATHVSHPAPQAQPQPQPPTVRPPVHSPPTTYGISSSKPELDQGKIVERLNSIEPPKGFERELIVIGHDIFAISVSKTKVFGKEKTEYKVGKVTNPVEDGVFLAKEYIPRVIVENGRVLAVEFLKASAQPKARAEQEEPSVEITAAEEPLESLMEKHLSEISSVFKEEPKKGDKRKKNS